MIPSMASIDAVESPFAWACERLERHTRKMGLPLGKVTADAHEVPVAWGLVKGRIWAYCDMIHIADGAFALAARAEGVPPEKAAMILRTRVALAKMREEVELALQSLRSEEA